MVRITQATEQDFPQVRSLFSEYLQWVIPLVEGVWGIPIPVTPADVFERDMADIQKFMPPEERLFGADWLLICGGRAFILLSVQIHINVRIRSDAA